MPIRKCASVIDVDALPDTTAWPDDGAGDSKTELLPPVTKARAALAWSDDEPDGDDVDPSWHAAFAGTAPFLFAAAAIALLVACVGAGWIWFDRGTSAPASTPPIPAIAAPPVSVTPTAAPPPTTTQPNPRPLQYDSRGVPMLPKDPTPEERRQVLVATFDHAGIPYGDPMSAEADADSVCAYLANGHHGFADMMVWVRNTRPALAGNPEREGGFLGASIGAYCRQYGYLLDPANESATS